MRVARSLLLLLAVLLLAPPASAEGGAFSASAGDCGVPVLIPSTSSVCYVAIEGRAFLDACDPTGCVVVVTGNATVHGYPGTLKSVSLEVGIGPDDGSTVCSASGHARVVSCSGTLGLGFVTLAPGGCVSVGTVGRMRDLEGFPADVSYGGSTGSGASVCRA